MKNQLSIMVDKLAKLEESGIYIEELRVSDRYKYNDANPMTLTGLPRPSGEYYSVDLSVLVRVDESFDETEILKTQLKEYPEVQDVCIKKKNNETPANIGTIIRRDTAIKVAKKAVKK